MGKNGRTFGQDMLDNEGGVRLAKGVRRSTGAQPVASQPGKRNARANAEPSGGGGGIWRREQDRLNDNRRRLAASAMPAGLNFGEIENYDGAERTITGTSIFDPVLCELSYRWFCPPGGLVLDPFAGGSVRGIVASHLGRRYVGVDLRPEQAAANEAQLPIAKKPKPKWIVGDALDVIDLCAGVAADMVFSCPPYGDLEVYSEDPRDLSVMEFEEFADAYQKIVARSCSLLKPDRFACFVVGDYRDRAGFYRGLPGMTVRAFEDAGLKLYNDAVLVTAVGSLPVRARKQFESSRKLGKTHQNYLVFVKGDPVKAAAAIGKVDFGEGDPLPEGADPASAFGDIL